MAVPNTIQRAKELVQQIAKNHGYLGEEKLRAIEPELRREIEEALLRKDEMIGSSVITLAKNLYTSKARFVFELLQNADDNNYTKAAAVGAAPYVSFRVFPHQITMECNEDGFTNENLEAICSVGKSSKSGSQGYIGEKGIGFKSVFMAAWKVHIQSGAFSFYFSHRNGESGMGMISPIWEDSQEERDSSLTKLTLHLHDTGESAALAKTYETIRQQFQELQETILLFMKHLRRIRVAFHGIDGAEISSTVYSIDRSGANHAVLTRAVAKDGMEEEHVKHYHVTTHQATDVPRHENRTYSGHADNTSQIVLAFPLSETSVPIVEPQDIFVYLPVRPVGFNFIIQADFVTDANRQDIVTDSLRNIKLLDGIADAFARAVLQFCEHDGLRLQWMRYLPDRNDKNGGSLWLSLVEKIADRLSQVPVLYCHKKFDRHLLKDLVRLASRDVDADGEPLFDDGDPEEVVSQQYISTDLDILLGYGLEYANIEHTIKWLAIDLARGAQSRMRSATTTDSWHTRTAKLLHVPFSQKWTGRIVDLKFKALLPLKGGTWVSITTGPVFFARVDGIDIPPNIGLRIIDEAITNSHRKTLFQDLGVKEAPISLVRKKVLELYEQPGPLHDLSVQTSKQHLTFLYLTQHLESEKEPCYSDIVIFDQDDCVRKPSRAVMYIATDKSPYSPWELLKGVSSLSGLGCDAPGFMAHYFMSSEYFLDPPQTPPNQTLAWVAWLHSHLGIRKYVHFGDTCLSDAAEYLQKHRPERFLGALRIHYLHNRRLSPAFIACVQKTKILCEEDQQICLKDAYVPVGRLEALVSRFVERDAFFPWLWLDMENFHDTAPEDWDRLVRVFNGGKLVNDLTFALDMLIYSVRSLPNRSTHASESKLFDLYGHIQLQYLAAGQGNEDKDRICEVFENANAIFIPPVDSDTWVSPEECVWDAPQKLQTKFALKIIYKPWLSGSSSNKDQIEQLFCGTLGVSDCDVTHYIDELKSLRESNSQDSDIITRLYEALYSKVKPGRPKKILRLLESQFEEHDLIYVASNDGSPWRKPSGCVWSAAARLRDKVSLTDEYEKLRGLFVDFLGVRPLTLSMAIDELKEAGGRQPVSIEEVKASLQTVNSLLPSEPGMQRPEFSELRVFPVRYPRRTVESVSTQTEFFIADRESLQLQFEGHVKFLDFSLEEVNELRPFLEWAQLGDRYISRCVRESTSVQASDARPIFVHGREIRHKAHAFLRIAKHYHSPRVATAEGSDAVYELLRNAKILVTDTISLEISVSQDGNSYQAKGDSIDIHLDEAGPNLKVYLPDKRDLQDHALKMCLPERLLQWLMTDSRTQIRKETSEEAYNAALKIWIAPLSTLSKTLDRCRIGKIDTPDLDAYTEDNPSDTDPHEGDGSEVVITPPSALGTMRHVSPGTYSESNSSASFTPDGTENESNGLPVRLSARSRTAISLEELPTRDTHYVRVLERVIASARTSAIPDRNENQPSTVHIGDSNICGSTQFERDCKVGAAGELFVFELLSHLDPALPDFSRANWQSNMRRFVTVHPDYTTMEPWEGRETSDITYNDSNGVLTELLIRNHYLDRDRWAGRTPKYFIEVKTTTSSCDAPFYMSNAQYQRMGNATFSEGDQNEIYVIFRVYQLDRGDQGPGLKVYVDPEALRLSGELDFTAQTWSVVPGANAL